MYANVVYLSYLNVDYAYSDCSIYVPETMSTRRDVSAYGTHSNIEKN